VTASGVKLIIAPAGAPSTSKLTLLFQPDGASTETVKSPVSPCFNLIDAGSTLRPNPVRAAIVTVLVRSARTVAPETISCFIVYFPSVVTLDVLHVNVATPIWEGDSPRGLLCLNTSLPDRSLTTVVHTRSG